MADDLSQYGIVSPAPASGALDLSKYGTVQRPAPSSWLDDVRDTVEQYFDKVNPVTQAQGLTSQAAHPIDAAKSYGQANQQLAQKAEDAFKNGNYAEGVRHSLSYLLNGIPGLGSALDEAGNKAGGGDAKGAIADTAALATNMLAAKVGPAVLDAASEPGALPAALSKVAAPVRAAAKTAADFAKTPGVADVIGGTGEALAGVGTALRGSPLVGAGVAIRGAKDAFKGITKYRAATAPAFQSLPQVEATPPAPGTMTVQPEALSLPSPTVTAASYNPPISGQIPQAAPAIIAPPAAAPVVETPVQPNASQMQTPTTPAAAPTPYDATAATLADTYKANAAKADEVKAQWMFDHGVTSDQLAPGQPFKALVDQIPNPNAKSGKFTTRVNDADHPARVKAVADLLDQKYAAAKAVDAAAALDKAGKSFTDARSMTPGQLGVDSSKEAADVLFELKKLQLAKTPPPAVSAAKQPQP